MPQVIRRVEKAAPDLVKRFSEIGESATIYEIMKKHAMSCEMSPVWP